MQEHELRLIIDSPAAKSVEPTCKFQQHFGDVHVSVEQGVVQRADSAHLAVEDRAGMVTQQSLHASGAAVVARFMQRCPARVV